MRIGVPKETKVQEHRVGLVPGGVRELVHHGHDVLVEKGAGVGSGFEDADYKAVGARIAKDAAAVFGEAEMIVKVKEPQPEEFARLRDGQILFTYLHLAAEPAVAKSLMETGVIAIAYETVTDAAGGLPLLAPMSEVAGRMAVQVGAHCLEKEQGGVGLLLGGMPGVPPAKVVVLGGGVVGTNAARMAMGMDAQVTVIDKSLPRLNDLDLRFGGQLNTIFSTVDSIETYVLDADLVVGAVLVAGASTPRLVTETMVKRMRRGSVLVDVAIDQGGCFETSRPTSHAEPTYTVHGVVHYCVTNMPAAVARTSALGLNNATLPFVLDLADKGYRVAMAEDEHLLHGLNVHKGRITHKAVGRALNLPAIPPESAIY
ncbi:MAG: alanine dehydrogenase [Alphaproteobacteria bacterium]|nr:alanine dehydrogenase [Alphaproteobacteria bacterium]